MKCLYWILGTAILLVMIEQATHKEAQGVCEPPQLSQVFR